MLFLSNDYLCNYISMLPKDRSGQECPFLLLGQVLGYFIVLIKDHINYSLFYFDVSSYQQMPFYKLKDVGSSSKARRSRLHIVSP